MDAPSDLNRVTRTSLEELAERIFHENNLLIEQLLAETGEAAEDMKDWAAQVAVPPLAEIPEGLLQSIPVFTVMLVSIAWPTLQCRQCHAFLGHRECHSRDPVQRTSVRGELRILCARRHGGGWKGGYVSRWRI